MEKKFDARIVFASLCLFLFAIYFAIGLQPVKAIDYEISTELSIPSIELNSGVTTLYLKNRELKTPDEIIGSFYSAKNKILLIGHSTTAFKNLDEIAVGDEIIYDESNYRVDSIEILAKNEVAMEKILAREEKETIIMMTCAGDLLGNGDATHRLIVRATKI